MTLTAEELVVITGALYWFIPMLYYAVVHGRRK